MNTNAGTGAVMIETKKDSIPQQRGMMNSDPEVLERPTRRRFTAEYKLRILQEATPAPNRVA